MIAALTAFFTAVANAANAYAKYLELEPLQKKWDIQDEIDALQKEIANLRTEGGSDSCSRADILVLRVEKLAERLKYLSGTNT